MAAVSRCLPGLFRYMIRKGAPLRVNPEQASLERILSEDRTSGKCKNEMCSAFTWNVFLASSIICSGVPVRQARTRPAIILRYEVLGQGENKRLCVKNVQSVAVDM